ncbi:hypothetical protein FGO68_gene2564 [Halteria grandinella]|uniref:Uncharacterized protein n=1 Tax=Halteria grandinella TaxID=5974 RepID=A0A8J8NVV3_HALGN|nr:hypothetical protein FGO68_gene2564 [Halteria grandinella]
MVKAFNEELLNTLKAQKAITEKEKQVTPENKLKRLKKQSSCEGGQQQNQIDSEDLKQYPKKKRARKSKCGKQQSSEEESNEAESIHQTDVVVIDEDGDSQISSRPMIEENLSQNPEQNEEFNQNLIYPPALKNYIPGQQSQKVPQQVRLNSKQNQGKILEKVVNSYDQCFKTDEQFLLQCSSQQQLIETSHQQVSKKTGAQLSHNSLRLNLSQSSSSIQYSTDQRFENKFKPLPQFYERQLSSDIESQRVSQEPLIKPLANFNRDYQSNQQYQNRNYYQRSNSNNSYSDQVPSFVRFPPPPSMQNFKRNRAESQYHQSQYGFSGGIDQSKEKNYQAQPAMSLPRRDFTTYPSNSNAQVQVIQQNVTTLEGVYGNFMSDVASHISTAKYQGGRLLCTVVWQVRPDGTQPMESIFMNTEVKRFNPLILCEFYERICKIVKNSSGDEEKGEGDN